MALVGAFGRGTMPTARPGRALPLLTATRWGALAISLSLAVAQETPLSQQLWIIPLVAMALWRLARPLRWSSTHIDLVRLTNEVGLSVLVIAMTGSWTSPFTFTLVTGAAALGLTLSRRESLAALALCASVIHLSALAHAEDLDRAGAQSALQWMGMLVIVALASSATRRLALDVADPDLARQRDVRRTNELLHSLVDLTPTLSTPIDAVEAASAWLASQDIADERGATVYAWDAAGATLQPLATSVGGFATAIAMTALTIGQVDRLTRGEPVELSPADLGIDRSVDRFADFTSNETPPIVVTPLVAGAQWIGAVALSDSESMSDTDIEELTYILENAALLGRLRTLGAETERTRIARDLHDRIGQSLASVAFEVDHMIRVSSDTAQVATRLSDLRSNVTDVIGEVRDTLHDLRSDVTVDRSAHAVLEEYLHRVARRSGLAIDFQHNEQVRAGLATERELVGIAKEAVTNIERHARATRVTVLWTSTARDVELMVSDDGVGARSTGALSRPGSYGMAGMAERARNVGGQLMVETAPGDGVRVRVKITR
jgi:signal transduction histidine kinase